MSKLFFIVGNSGSGKDSLVQEVIKSYPKNLKEIKIPKRVISRPPSPETEDYESVDEKTFLQWEKEEKFALTWHIYGLHYGVKKEIMEWMKQGHPVLINVSRLIIESARKRFPNLRVVFVQVPFEITKARIKERGREDEEGMQARLDRARKNQTLPNADFVVDNSGKLEHAAKTLLDYILSEIKQ
jgi:phosphonate metabolism protein PhnN/1,5-bisphosphokinase (PRPP-forming)